MYTLIATAGRPDLLARTLSSLERCRLPAGYRQTIVIENGGKHGAEEVVRAAPARLSCIYRYAKSGNKSAALNLGLADVPDNALVYFTDDDIRLAPDTLISYAGAHAAGGNHFFGGQADVDYEVEPPNWLVRYLPMSAQGWRPRDPSSSSLIFLGFNWAARAGDIKKLGGFDPERGPGAPSGSTGQESDMQRRLLRAGLSSKFVHEARVWHYVPAERLTPAWILERQYRHGVECGLQSPVGPIRLAGCPPWVLARLGKGAIRAAVSLLYGGEAFRFDSRAKRSYNRGLVSGCRQQLRRRRLDLARGHPLLV